MNIKIRLLLIVLFISFYGCGSTASDKKIPLKEFEGVITYHEIQKSNDGSFDVNDTVKMYYSHGNYVNIHSDKSIKLHTVKDYYFEKLRLRLFLNNKSDTLYQLPLTLPIERLDGFKVTKMYKNVLSQICENIEVNISYNKGHTITYSDMNFVIPTNYLKVDKEHFKNWNLGFFNKVINKSGCFYLKLTTVHFDSSHKNIISSKTLDAISVKEETVNSKIFEIDQLMIAPANGRL